MRSDSDDRAAQQHRTASAPADATSAPRRESSVTDEPLTPKESDTATTSHSWSGRSLASRLAKITAALVVFYFLAAYVIDHWEEIRGLELQVRWWLLAASCLLLMGYLTGRVLVWQYLTQRTGIAIPLRKAFPAWMYSQMGKYVPGKIFLFLGRLYFYRREGRSQALLAIAFLVETIGTFLASVFVVLLALLTVDIPGMDRYRPWLGAGLVVLSILLHPWLLERATNLGLRLFGRRQVELPLSFVDALRFVGTYILNWVVFGAAFYLFILSMFEIDLRYIIYLAGAFSLSNLIGMISVFVPAGFGVREGVIIFMLNQVMPTSASIIVALTSRLWITGVEGLTVGATYVATRGTAPTRGELESLAADERPTKDDSRGG